MREVDVKDKAFKLTRLKNKSFVCSVFTQGAGNTRASTDACFSLILIPNSLAYGSSL